MTIRYRWRDDDLVCEEAWVGDSLHQRSSYLFVQGRPHAGEWLPDHDRHRGTAPQLPGQVSEARADQADRGRGADPLQDARGLGPGLRFGIAGAVRPTSPDPKARSAAARAVHPELDLRLEHLGHGPPFLQAPCPTPGVTRARSALGQCRKKHRGSDRPDSALAGGVRRGLGRCWELGPSARFPTGVLASLTPSEEKLGAGRGTQALRVNI